MPRQICYAKITICIQWHWLIYSSKLKKKRNERHPCTEKQFLNGMYVMLFFLVLQIINRCVLGPYLL